MSIEDPHFSPLEGGEPAYEGTEQIEAPVDAGVRQALALIKERYEGALDPRDRLPFHNVAHTEGVIDRTAAILTVIHLADPQLVSERDIALGRLAAARHDTRQLWEEQTVSEGAFTKVLRRRSSGQSEQASAEEAVAYMQQANQHQVIFSPSDFRVVTEAIAATISDWDNEHATAKQPKLEASSSLVARALALADLGTAGAEGGQTFTAEGKLLFLEENLDIFDAVNSHGINGIPTEQHTYFRERMVRWLDSQVGFIRGRQQRLAVELEPIPEPARTRVAALFGHFDRSIATAEAAAERNRAMTFPELARDMGY